jgi:hypothetical protein
LLGEQGYADVECTASAAEAAARAFPEAKITVLTQEQFAERGVGRQFSKVDQPSQ